MKNFALIWMKNICFKKIKNRIVEGIYSFFHNRSVLALIHDLFVVALSIQVSVFLRLGGDLSQLSISAIMLNTALYLLFATAVFLGKHVYRGMWRYASLGDLISIAVSVTYITLLYVSVMFLLPPHFSLPRSAPLINWFVLMAFLGSPRLFYRLYRQRRNRTSSLHTHKSKRALIVGYGDQAELFIREVLRQGDDTYELVGLVGSNAIYIGQQIHHVPVVGTITEISTIVQQFREKDTPIELLIVADETLSSAVLTSLTSLVDALDLGLARLPRISEITDPSATPQVKPIEIEDLLGRPQASLDRDSMQAMIKGKRVLITGAGGTIGGELVRQISDFEPSHLCLVDHSEYLLYMADLELSERHPSLPSEKMLADVSCRERIYHIFSGFKPELVFHAAALKHVPLVEANPSEGCLTNVIGTRNVADACRKFGVQVMLLISTDKAINPTSVMGATKRLAECYCQALDILEQQKPNGTRYVSVRFGNVLGSSGSVVPLFKRQIEKGGPLTLTHPDMTRYFMTVHEAVELVLQATALALHAVVQSGRVFVLDMGEPVKILDLAKQMIRLAGLKLDVDIEIKYVGLRPGEKLFEKLFHDSEHLHPTSNASILLGAPRTLDYGFLIRALHELETHANNQSDEVVKRLLQTLVPEYKTLDQGKVASVGGNK